MRPPISSDDAWRSLRQLHWPSLRLHLLPGHWPSSSPPHGSWYPPPSSLEFLLGALRLRVLARTIGPPVSLHIPGKINSNRLGFNRKYAQMTTRAQSSWIDDLAHGYSHGYTGASWILQQPPLAWFLWTAHSNAAAKVWGRILGHDSEGAVFVFFVVGRLLRTIRTADRISEHEPWSGRMLPKQTWSKQPPSVFIPVEPLVAS